MISSERATGVTTSTLTISPVREEDEDKYYCVTTNGGVDGMRYSDRSQVARLTVFGKNVHFEKLFKLILISTSLMEILFCGLYGRRNACLRCRIIIQYSSTM